MCVCVCVCVCVSVCVCVCVSVCVCVECDLSEVSEGVEIALLGSDNPITIRRCGMGGGGGGGRGGGCGSGEEVRIEEVSETQCHVERTRGREGRVW